jgi:hypothetical protein
VIGAGTPFDGRTVVWGLLTFALPCVVVEQIGSGWGSEQLDKMFCIWRRESAEGVWEDSR